MPGRANRIASSCVNAWLPAPTSATVMQATRRFFRGVLAGVLVTLARIGGLRARIMRLLMTRPDDTQSKALCVEEDQGCKGYDNGFPDPAHPIHSVARRLRFASRSRVKI